MNIKEIYLNYKDNKGEIGSIFASDEFKNSYHFHGKLGAIYSKDETIFRVWTPVAKEVVLEIFDQIEEDKFVSIEKMKLTDLNGIFEGIIKKDLNGKYYRYIVKVGDKEVISCDPYAKGTSANGEYSMIVDFKKTNPKDWENDKKPKLEAPIDSIIYEAHVRDFTIDENSGVNNKGKFLGFVEEGTTIENTKIKTGLDHLKELGITHVHLLPVSDYKTVDEKALNEPQYNWGYDPDNYNCLEGSYSTNPFYGEVRIKEFKEMVLKLHEAGIRVIMDVVYNHTYESIKSNFNKLVPMYYYREAYDGEFSNGSGCGNEVASERSMVRKYIVDSVKFFAKEYHIDGFRFDLMGLHDIETMKELREELNKIDKSILMYGEGWTGGWTPLQEYDRAVKYNMYKFDNEQVAAFSDDMRDGIKGEVFAADRPGFANGQRGLCERIKSGIVGSVRHDEVYYNYWANEPYQTINYASAHDNYTLWDKLQQSTYGANEEELIKINKLIATIILTSQGIPFIHSGEELLRTKKDINGKLIENSYNSSDLVNKIDWIRKEKYSQIFEYYKKLIGLRKRYKAFKLGSSEEIRKSIHFKPVVDNMIEYTINCENLEKLLVIYNGNEYNIDVDLDDGEWSLILDGNDIYERNLEQIKDKISVEGRTATILIKNNIYTR